MDKELKIFKALAHTLRMDIINLLSESGELCVCVIQDKFKVSQSNLSQHLKILKEATILNSRKEGGWVYYSLKNKIISDILKQLNKY